jgi:predicted enzyme related to lactoylglutathione lyase
MEDRVRIRQQAFRVYADPAAFEQTIRFYEEMQSIHCERRVLIAETGVQVAKIGGFLLLSGTEEQLKEARQVGAIFYVEDIVEAAVWLKGTSAEITRPLRTVTGGRNLTARHPDGLIAEYFEPKAPVEGTSA